MTIKGFWDWVNTENLLEVIVARKLKGKFIAIDAHLFFNASRCTIKARYVKTIDPFREPVDEDYVDNMWIPEILRRIMEMLDMQFIPVFVYDSPTKDPLKIDTLAKRRKNDTNTIDKIKELKEKYTNGGTFGVTQQDITLLRSLYSRINRLPLNSLNKAIEFIKGIGIPWVLSNGEGERTCALLTRAKICWAVMSKDGDSVAAGATRVLKDRDFYKAEGTTQSQAAFKCITLKKVLKHLGLNLVNFQDVCIFAGSDFGETKGIAFKTALRKMDQLDTFSFEGLKKKKVDISDFDYVEIRKRFHVVDDWKETASEYSLDFDVNLKRDKRTLKLYDINKKKAYRLSQLKQDILDLLG